MDHHRLAAKIRQSEWLPLEGVSLQIDSAANRLESANRPSRFVARIGTRELDSDFLVIDEGVALLVLEFAAERQLQPGLGRLGCIWVNVNKSVE